MAKAIPVYLRPGRSWSKKGDAAAHFKNMLGRYAIGERVVDEEDHADLLALLTAYDAALPDGAPQKAGNGIAYFEKRVDQEHEGRTKCFYVVRRDGTSDNFSYPRALDALATSTSQRGAV